MIYLDNAATSFPKAPGVAEALFRQCASMGGNPGRSGHSMALEADRLLFDARCAVAGLLGLESPDRFVFTKNATEALNAVILGSVRPGAVVATSSLEHNAVMRPLRWLEKARGVEVIVVACDECGRPDPAGLVAAAARRPDLAVFTMASNVTGAFLPWEEIARLFGGAGAAVCLDASQAVGHMPLSLGAAGVDFACFPGHKGLLGPTGTGGFCLAGERVPEPLIRGGTGSRSHSEEQPEDLPDRFEAGTQNLPGAAGLLASVAFLAEAGLDAVRAREYALADRLLLGLKDIGGMRVYGPPAGEARAPVVSVGLDPAGLDALAESLDSRGIAVRTGLHCAPAAHRSIGSFASGGTIRFSPGFFTTEAEIDETLAAVGEMVGRRGRGPAARGWQEKGASGGERREGGPAPAGRRPAGEDRHG